MIRLSFKAPHVSAGRPYFLVEAAPAITTPIAVPVPSAVTEMTSTKTGPKARAAIAAMAISAAVSTTTVSAAIPATVAVLDVLNGRRSVRHGMNAKRRS